MNSAWKHTPPPWTWEAEEKPIDPTTFRSSGYYGNPLLVGPNGETIISAGDGEYMPYRGAANALLIATAPELLVALQAFVDARKCVGWNEGECDLWLGPEWHRAVDAINKATGREG